jgi:uncharacterized membrane protein
VVDAEVLRHMPLRDVERVERRQWPATARRPTGWSRCGCSGAPGRDAEASKHGNPLSNIANGAGHRRVEAGCHVGEQRGGILHRGSRWSYRLSSWRWSAVPPEGEIVAVGPVDVYIIGFPGNKFSGRIVPAIMELVDNRTIRILDLLFVTKDADGVVTKLEAADVDEDGAGFVSIKVAHPGALGAEDAEEVSDDLPSNSSALLIAFENLWTAKVVEALQDADGVLIDSIRIPVEVVTAALDER